MRDKLYDSHQTVKVKPKNIVGLKFACFII